MYEYSNSRRQERYWRCPAALAPTHNSSAPPEEAPAAARVQATAAPTAASTRDVAPPVELAVTLPRSRREPAPPEPPRTKALSAPHRLEPPKPVAADVGRSHPKPACTSCKSDGAEDGGVAVVGGACRAFCSTGGYCGRSHNYRQGVDCRSRSTYAATQTHIPPTINHRSGVGIPTSNAVNGPATDFLFFILRCLHAWILLLVALNCASLRRREGCLDDALVLKCFSSLSSVADAV